MNDVALQCFLEVTIPLAIADLQRRGGPLDCDWEEAREFGQVLGEKGDQILFRSKETAGLVARLARACAVMSFVPGGFRFGGTAWCQHHPGGRRDTGVCDVCLEGRAA